MDVGLRNAACLDSKAIVAAPSDSSKLSMQPLITVFAA
jgi:hypothetical protein